MNYLAVDFFNEISLLYGTITEFCTTITCPIMSAGPDYEYLWKDGVKFKKPTQVWWHVQYIICIYYIC